MLTSPVAEAGYLVDSDVTEDERFVPQRLIRLEHGLRAHASLTQSATFSQRRLLTSSLKPEVTVFFLHRNYTNVFIRQATCDSTETCV